MYARLEKIEDWPEEVKCINCGTLVEQVLPYTLLFRCPKCGAKYRLKLLRPAVLHGGDRIGLLQKEFGS